LKVKVIFHQIDVYLRPRRYKSESYTVSGGIIRQIDVL